MKVRFKKVGKFICDQEKRILKVRVPRIGRLGRNIREYCLEDMNGQELMVTHGGETRSLLRFLNTGKYKHAWTPEQFVSKEAREQFEKLRSPQEKQ